MTKGVAATIHGLTAGVLAYAVPVGLIALAPGPSCANCYGFEKVLVPLVWLMFLGPFVGLGAAVVGGVAAYVALRARAARWVPFATTLVAPPIAVLALYAFGEGTRRADDSRAESLADAIAHGDLAALERSSAHDFFSPSGRSVVADAVERLLVAPPHALSIAELDRIEDDVRARDPGTLDTSGTLVRRLGKARVAAAGIGPLVVHWRDRPADVFATFLGSDGAYEVHGSAADLASLAAFAESHASRTDAIGGAARLVATVSEAASPATLLPRSRSSARSRTRTRSPMRRSPRLATWQVTSRTQSRTIS